MSIEKRKTFGIGNKVFVLVLLSLPLSAGEKCKYRDFSSTHTMCVYSGLGCEVTRRGISQSDVKVIVDSHNTLRSQTATTMSAANMFKMKWDEELATVAQRLVDQCKPKRDCRECRTVDRFEVGQNLRHFTRTSSQPSNDTSANWEKTVKVWYDTKNKMPNASAKSYQFHSESSMYSQMVWAETKLIGCGYVNFQNGRRENKIYVCNYGPESVIITSLRRKRDL